MRVGLRRVAMLWTLWSGLGLLPSMAAVPEYSRIMPRAPQSLLLDISRVGGRVFSVGERGHILYSDNLGIDWSQARVPTVQMLTALYFTDERHGWTVGHDGLILATDDGGQTWRIQRDGLLEQAKINLVRRDRARDQVQELKAAGAGRSDAPDHLVERLEEAMMALEDAELLLEEPVFAPPLMDIWFQDVDTGWAVGAFGLLLATHDGGRHWHDISSVIDNPDERHLNAIVGDGRGRLFIAGETGWLLRSDDQGAHWQPLASPYQGSWFGLVYSDPAAALLVFGLRGTIYRSGDGGDSWSRPATDIRDNLSAGHVGARGAITIVGAVGSIARSGDGGHSFDSVLLPDRPGLNGIVDDGRGGYLLVGQGGVRRLSATDPILAGKP